LKTPFDTGKLTVWVSEIGNLLETFEEGKHMRKYLILAAVAGLMGTGCDRTANTGGPGGNTTTTSHNHSHDDHSDEHQKVAHTHADGTQCTCEHGPNNGHLFKFDNENYKGEWVHSNDNDVIRFYILNGMDENTPLKVDSFVIKSTSGSEEAVFEAEPENADAEGKSHAFMVEDKDLRIATRMGVSVVVTSGDLVLTGTIEPHEPHDH
jgi:hypothetical protein